MTEMTFQYGIDAEFLPDVFPFHLIFDQQMHIVQYGPVLKKLLPTIETGQLFSDLVHILTPANIGFNFNAIEEQRFSIFFVQLIAVNFTLKGQMLKIGKKNKQKMLFLCSPVVREMEAVEEMGLSLNDFAIHDSVVDFLILLQTKNNTINDVKKMSSRLKKEVATRREAELQLKEANLDLEKKVDERTKELTISNQYLNNEVNERKHAQAELQLSMQKLELRNQQMMILNKMGDMLQACSNVSETYQVIIDSIQQLFPRHSGALSLYNEKKDEFSFVADFGSYIYTGLSFRKNDCWGLRRGRTHIAKQLNEKSICNHFTSKPNNGYICVPLTVGEEQLGMLHIYSHDASDFSVKNAHVEEIDQLQQILITASEHIALAIANLKLRESLWQQSIRDKLTGLYNRRYMEEALNQEIMKATRHKKTVAIIMCDVDHFKHFNDTYGHQAGDVLLENLGKLLNQSVRGEDIACRYGGEEFFLLMPGADLAVAMGRAENIRHAVENDFKVEFDPIEIS